MAARPPRAPPSDETKTKSFVRAVRSLAGPPRSRSTATFGTTRLLALVPYARGRESESDFFARRAMKQPIRFKSVSSFEPVVICGDLPPVTSWVMSRPEVGTNFREYGSGFDLVILGE
ncbi:hypothetical protein NL676_009320 [Syzygium grande]|nr:hypothetical protein NL676_009320 [Syzygium grande]